MSIAWQRFEPHTLIDLTLGRYELEVNLDPKELLAPDRDRHYCAGVKTREVGEE
jgi:hypothetical protein